MTVGKPTVLLAILLWQQKKTAPELYEQAQVRKNYIT